jgi:hypothetical protein
MANRKRVKIIALVLLISLINQTIFPTVVYALTSGPSQPEFSSFEPVATTTMVNEFSGDFTYNLPVMTVPGANGGGYPISLSYHSGASPEEEASWVGYGWTLNPGAINRSTRGFPDDSKAKVTYHNKVPTNWTATLGFALDNEIFSNGPSLGGNAAIRYNNYKGFGYIAGVSFALTEGKASIGLNVSDGEPSFSARINPMEILANKSEKNSKEELVENTPVAKGCFAGKKVSKVSIKNPISGVNARNVGKGAVSFLSSSYAYFNFGKEERALSVAKYSGASVNVSYGIEFNPMYVNAGPNMSGFGTYTYQSNTPSAELNTYGYMYSADAKSSGMMDYYTEKLSTYDRNDKFLGTPFSNADIYNVSGEGIGGAFRLYHKNTGYFSTNKVSSSILITNLGQDVGVGPSSFQIGNTAAIGWQNLKISGEWGDSIKFSNAGDEPYYFRFNNDLGGAIRFNQCVEQPATNIGQLSDMPYAHPPATQTKYNLDFNINTESNANQVNSRAGRSSYIAYHTNAEMSDISANKLNSKQFYAYTRDASTNHWVKREDAVLSNGVGEVVVFNESGARYAYGLPVYSRNEHSLQFDLMGVPSSNIKNNYLAYKDVDGDNNIKVGEDRLEPYATNYLLTEITDADYLDKTLNGPSLDDLGGYTQFIYDRAYGSYSKDINNVSSEGSSNWFNWRTPYNGLLYNRASLSDQKDDVGSFSSGEKEIYYLKNIATKTHVAIFNLTDREDGLEAPNDDVADLDPNSKGTLKLKKLVSIELYSIDDVTYNTTSKTYEPNSGAIPIKTVHFEYFANNAGLCKNLPNATDATYGKLTLKRVWFEFEGVKLPYINPYEFEYQYPSNPTYPSKYSSLVMNTSSMIQNPNYDPNSIDAWGNYQPDGVNRFNNMQNWVNQRANDIGTFDPAAWQLKVIKMPSGGEIHVQYEQDDYAYVQDRHAMAMVKIANVVADNIYKLDISNDLGVDLTNSITRANYIKILNNEFKDERIYFKFLYQLVGNNTPSLSSCNAEYVDGYANVQSFVDDGSNGINVVLGSGAENIPHKICRDFVKSERAGMLNLTGNCNAATSGVPENTSALKVVKSLAGFLLTTLIPNTSCQTINNSFSYFRIPVLNKKYGGGIRVKRLLMFDAGIESGQSSLYGKEYIYQTESNEIPGMMISSGVAVNEPPSTRFENPLVNILPRFRQSLGSRIFAGKNKKKTEGPIGETLLPGAAVGYSKVIIKDIHSGKTNSGITVKEFYTAFDYPTIKVNETSISTDRVIVPPLGLPIEYIINKFWLTQGYTFELNNMHGQIKSISQYGADYSDIFNPEKRCLYGLTEYKYFEPGEKVPTLEDYNGIVSSDNIGMETELNVETRAVEDNLNDIGLELDFNIPFVPLPPSASFMISYKRVESAIITNVNTKVIRYAAIQKSIKTIIDGRSTITENKAFDPQNGEPIVTVTYDDFHNVGVNSVTQNGAITKVSIPATQRYKEFSQKAFNERYKAKNIEIVYDNTNYYFKFNDSNRADMQHFVKGDWVLVRNSLGTAVAMYNVLTGSIDRNSSNDNRMYITPAKNFNASGANLSNATLEVVRSGRTNQLNLKAGEIVLHGLNKLIKSNLPYTDNEYISRRNFALLLNTKLNSSNNSETFSVSSPTFSNSYGNCKTGTFTLQKNYSNKLMLFKFLNSDGNELITYLKRRNPDVGFTGFVAPVNLNTQPEGFFDIDEATGQIVYYSNPDNKCEKQLVKCAYFCSNFDTQNQLDGVISASAVTYDDNWNYANLGLDNYLNDASTSLNDFEKGFRGKYHVKDEYIYLAPTNGITTSGNYNYNSGEYNLINFIYSNPSLNNSSKWIKVNKENKYTSNGYATETKDALNIPSIKKYIHHTGQAYLSATNSDLHSAFFESFEYNYPSVYHNVSGKYIFEDGCSLSTTDTRCTIDNTTSHSGKKSIKYSYGGSNSDAGLILKKINTDFVYQNGLDVKFWLKQGSGIYNFANNLKVNILNANTVEIGKNVKQIAKVGEWTLYQATFNPQEIAAGNNYTVGIAYAFNTSSAESPFFLDDIRFQPLNAQMMTYVYDQRKGNILTIFDDQHFGMYYQYNAEGKLMRKQKETEKGLKTIVESYQNIVPKSR